MSPERIVASPEERLPYETGIWLAKHWLAKAGPGDGINVGRETLRILIAGYERMGRLEGDLKELQEMMAP